MTRIKYLLFALFVLFFYTLPVWAMQATSTPAAPTTTGTALTGKIIAVAAVVAAVLQGLKKFIPVINGWVAVLLSVLLALAGAYATADPGSVMSIQFFVTTLLAALGANGIHSFMQVAGGQTSTGPTTSRKV